MQPETGYRNVIIVDNLPIVTPEKYEKLSNLLKKVLNQIAPLRDDAIFMPLDPVTKQTSG